MSLEWNVGGNDGLGMWNVVRQGLYEGFWWQNLLEKNHLEDPKGDWGIKIILILRK
jgi:hypothetical protein